MPDGTDIAVTPCPAARSVAPCPWCGAGTRLSIAGNGLGGSFVFCTRCAGKGPSAEIGDDFDAGDEAAIRSWSARADAAAPRLPAEVLARLEHMLDISEQLHADLGTAPRLTLSCADLRQLLAATGRA